MFSFKGRTKLSWHPTRYVEFVGKDGPPATKYTPIKEKHNFVNLKYSVGRDMRFHIPSSKQKIWKQVPV